MPSSSPDATRAATDPTALRVLMVDDSAAFCQTVGAWLSKEKDIHFVHCQDTAKAVQVAAEFDPALIIQDMIMPGTDGLEMIRAYRRQPSTALTPVIVLSADDSADKKTAAFLVGADDYVRKDAERVEFLARIRYHATRFLAMQREGLHRHAVFRGAGAHTVRVLVIEPTRTGQQVLGSAFRQQPDVDVRFCSDDRTALRMADEHLPTVVVVSLFGGAYDGFELIQRMRERRATRDVPIILYTSTDEPSLKARAFECGANDYAIRTSNLDDLVARVKRHSSQHFMTLQARFAAAAGTADSERIRAVMIDNEGEIGRSVEAMLRSERSIDFSLVHAPGRALATIREQQPTLVLLNLDMPQVDGLDILRTIRDDPAGQELPILLISSQAPPTVKARAFALGADDLMNRDVDKIELVSRVLHHARSHMSSRHLRRALESAMQMERRVDVQSDFIRRTFGRYLSDGVVEAILDDPEGLRLGGEARTVTLMMTDLRGFTNLSDAQPPHVVIEMLNGYFEVMTRVLMSYDATIDEFVGDAILAIFGAPHAMPDHAERAVACAIAMQNAMTEVNDALRKRDLPELEMGIGLNTGDVVVGNVGSERRTKYGVVGRNVNLTSRIESYTTGGQILAAESTLLAAGGVVKTRSQRRIEPKGFKDGVTVHEVTGIEGQHRLELKPVDVDFAELVVPLRLLAFPFEGKQRGDTPIEGEVLRIGPRGAIVRWDAGLALGDNLQLTFLSASGAVLTGDVMAKVVGSTLEPGMTEVRFTSMSPSVRAALAAFGRGRT